MAKPAIEIPHENQGRFTSALTYTAATTGFNPRLIEKDYYCSLLLRELSPLFDSGLIFKGGTSLSKIHASFHRLSEDLDFMISIDADAKRSQRREAIAEAKSQLDRITASLSWLTVEKKLTGANESTQYAATFSYQSQISGQADNIRMEVGLRELLLESAETRSAATVMLDPHSEEPLVEPISVVAMSRRESYAEKVRACLCRRDPAIRDFFDIDRALEANILDLTDNVLMDLIRRKLGVSPKVLPDVSPSRFQALRDQVEPQLRPVLRDEDFTRFGLERVLAAMLVIYENLGFAEGAR